MRAVAVGSVILHHIDRALLPSGFLGVDIFFVISGFVITASLDRHRGEPFGAFLLSFYVRRIKRLVPALLACLVVTGAVGSLFVPPLEITDSLRAGLNAIIGISNLYFYRQSTDYFSSSADLNLFTHTWSLGVEEQFYLLFPALFWWLARARDAPSWLRPVPVVAGLSLVSLIAFLALLRSMPHAAYYLMPLRLWELGAGSLVYLLVPRPAAAGRGQRVLVVAAVAGLALSFVAPREWQGLATVVAVAGAAALIATLQPGSWVYRALTLRGVVLIGLASYSLYLWHWSVLALARWTIGVSVWTVPILVALMLALALASYVWLEKPLRERRWAARPIVALGIGAGLLAASAAVLALLQFPLKGKLFTGELAVLEERGGRSLSADRWRNGARIWPAADCILSAERQIGRPMPSAPCLIKSSRPGTRRFLVVGNSFAAAEFDLVAALAEQGRGDVVITASWGAPPLATMPNYGLYQTVNDHYLSVVVPKLIDELGAGDTLIMIYDLTQYLPAGATATTQADMATLRDGLDQLARRLAEKGVAIVFQSAVPFMRESECSPDMAILQWYHPAGHAPCRLYSAVETARRQAPLSRVLAELSQRHANFHVLDLMGLLCPAATCTYQGADGAVLYRDGVHLSVAANRLATPRLLEIADRIIASQRGGRPSP